MAAVATGIRQAKQNSKRKAARKKPRQAKPLRKSRQAKPLPPPIELPDDRLLGELREAKNPPSEPANPPGLFAALKANLLGTPAQPTPALSEDSSALSPASEPAALSAEAEALLATVPGASQSAVGLGQGSEEADNDSISSGEVRELMDLAGDFMEDDVRELLEELFESLADYFGSEHWKLTAKQSNRLSRPMTRLLNSLWQRLCEYLPDVIARWCESTPGAAGVIFAAGIVVVPKAMKQRRLSAKSQPEPTPAQPAKAAAKPAAKPNGEFSHLPQYEPEA